MTLWIDHITPQLKQITGHNSTKKRQTITAVLLAEAEGQPIDWNRKDICSRSTWYEVWKHDPDIQSCLAGCREVISDTRSVAAAETVARALLKLQNAAEQAADTLVALLSDKDSAQRRHAANSILSKASKHTADKEGSDLELPGLDEAIERIYGQS